MMFTRGLFNTLHCAKKLLFNRCLNTTSYRYDFGSYEGPNSMTVTMLNTSTNKFLIEGIRTPVFYFNNQMKVVGSMIVFPETLLAWNVHTALEITEPSLELLAVLNPRPEIVIIGLDKQYDWPVVNGIRDILRKFGYPSEIMPVQKAIGTFNLLCEEGRFVVGGFIPPPPQIKPKPSYYLEESPAQNNQKLEHPETNKLIGKE
ncbi:NADH dehydrogenase [ubiquinone] 1 alpha subcomplex assembly factor 3 [Prorops nasuta]|uniref:NADH dehydrogenase [ubiquinone] 1 alpha subcomplex assembly factor 3 n=1 Tax=Prorops nasuta TaxID=863751 RepID=UPI0034CF2A5E